MNMLHTYKNKRTGNVIKVRMIVSGTDWEEVIDAAGENAQDFSADSLGQASILESAAAEEERDSEDMTQTVTAVKTAVAKKPAAKKTAAKSAARPKAVGRK